MQKIRKIFLIITVLISSFLVLSCSHPEIVAKGFQDFAWLYCEHRANSWEPRTLVFKGISEKTGRYENRQVKYAPDYPNSYIDVYYTTDDPEKSKDAPFLTFSHGGCFWWGDNTTGNPIVRTDLDRFIAEFNKRGFNVVIIDYSFTPDYLFPTQLIQFNQALKFIRDNNDTFKLNFNKVFLGGNSAGAVLISQYATLVSNPDYRKLINFPELAVSRDEVKAVEIDDGFWDWEWMADPIKMCAGVYMNRSVYLSRKQVYKYDVIQHINDNYVPTCIVNGVFTHDSYRYYNTLQSKKIDSIIIDGKGNRGEFKTHCYLITDIMLNNEKNVTADFERLIEFFKKQL